MAESPASDTLVLRYIHRGETLRNGRILLLPGAATDRSVACSGHLLLEALASSDANLPMHRLVALYYSKALEGWQRLHPTSKVPLPPTESVARVEVMLEPPATRHEEMASASTAERRFVPLSMGAAAAVGDTLDPQQLAASVAADGFFGIGVYNSKSVDNVGTLWRSAFMLGASYIFTIGSRNAWEKCADTYKAWRHVPAIRYHDWNAFAAAAPFSTQMVAVEMGGVPLEEFEHPERAVYILGAEDAGLPASIVRACAHCISLGGVRAKSYNVAVAGSLIMYDRYAKLGGGAQAQAHAQADPQDSALLPVETTVAGVESAPGQAPPSES